MGLPLRLLFLLLLPSLPTTTFSLSSEGMALLSLNIANTTDLQWNSSDVTPCNWQGIRCDHLHHVTSIRLARGNITGDLSFVSKLPYLSYLDFAGNDLSGTIPTSLRSLTNLTYISVFRNHLSGHLPPLSGLTNLTYVSFYRNHLSGQLPPFSGLPHLSYLELSSNHLSGTIPNSICALTGLTYLALYDNNLSGSLPPCLFQLPNLDTVYLNGNAFTGNLPPTLGLASKASALFLYSNSFTGPIPESITNLTNLVQLYLNNNLFNGSLPDDLGSLGELQYLDVSNNSLVGTIPPSLGSCSKMRDLVLSHNYLEGVIPPQLGNCTDLFVLAVLGNRLSGPIPSSLGFLSNLHYMYLNENNLSGGIPPELGNCTQLYELQLHMNRLEGGIPRELGNFSNIQRLTLFRNQLTGDVPVEIWRLRSLEEVLIYDNNLSGELPAAELGDLYLLKNISLFNNNFSGPIPRNFGSNAFLEQVDLTNNRFSGEIPDGICDRKQLTVLNLGRNLFNGSVPDSIGRCSSLRRLILSHNNLTGQLPDFVDDSSLLYVDMSGNGIGGNLPASLGNCRNLTTLKMSGNRITGQIPEDFGNLVELEVLNVSSNNLVGELPRQLAHCSRLSSLDLGGNCLNGSIPSSLSNLTLLTHLILRDNLFSGEIPDFLQRFGRLLELQLGGNKFEGSIPPSIGHIEGLSIILNLSNNRLTGELPPELGNLQMLQALDLSVNDLAGSLLPLGRLVSLMKVNISYNHFTGPIPVSWLDFLRSSPSSFWGNPALCVPCVAGDLSGSRSGCLEPCSTGSSTNIWHLLKFHIVLISFGSLIFLLVIFIIGCTYVRGHKGDSEIKPSTSKGSSSSLLLNKVMEATENLNERYLLGKGAHGIVYKAVLSQEEVYAVKKLEFTKRKGSNKSMTREVETLGKIRHRNLVKLVDFWIQNRIGFIVYQYMPNGSLHDVLHERKPPPELTWCVRYRIALGVAQGLAYLHHDCNPPIVHSDIKPRNILLDADLEPHISDFGIAKLMDQCSSSVQSTAVVGTPGYMPPETAFSTRKSKGFDVYGYGVVLLELITRREVLGPSYPENEGLVNWAKSVLDEANDDTLGEVVDLDLLHGLMGSSELEEVKALLALALRCTAKEPSARPSMRDVVKELTGFKSRKSHCTKRGKQGENFQHIGRSCLISSSD